MTDFWKKHHFECVRTEDQSPTLRWLASENQETMHHRGGAYSETQEIYGNPLRLTLAQGGRSAVSVGLGLGYNEMLVATECLQNGIGPEEFQLLSFESEAILKQQFVAWLEARDFDPIYDQVWQFFAKDHPSISQDQIRKWLLDSMKHKTWNLQGALTPESTVSRQYECIFYDAFSSKTSPHLWAEDFLMKLWQQICAANCLITTYACTGALKRSLKNSNFELVLTGGFQSKRQRTMGRRGFALAPRHSTHSAHDFENQKGIRNDNKN